MARPSNADARRRALLPLLARTFAESGYRRTTTAALARRCEVPENTLYRLWQDKKSMYLESIDFLFARTLEIWEARLAQRAGTQSAAEELLDYEAVHYGEHGFYRIIFAGLSETDDPDIRQALRRMYKRFHAFISAKIAEHRDCPEATERVSLLAWAIVGMGSVSGIGRELGLINRRRQQALFTEVGKRLLDL